jgi:hypothetical protein
MYLRGCGVLWQEILQLLQSDDLRLLLGDLRCYLLLLLLLLVLLLLLCLNGRLRLRMLKNRRI